MTGFGQEQHWPSWPLAAIAAATLALAAAGCRVAGPLITGNGTDGRLPAGVEPAQSVHLPRPVSQTVAPPGVPPALYPPRSFHLPDRALLTNVPRAPALAPVDPEVVRYLKPSGNYVALTFDACQTMKPAGYDRAIIRVLRETNTPATLMLSGRWMETHPGATRDLGHDPLFELGSHSYLHPHMRGMPEAHVREELQKTQDILFALAGKQAALFRPPYGEYDDALVRIAAKLGMRTLMWSVVTGDPDRHTSAQSIIHTVQKETGPGSMIIMHMNGRGWHTAEALPTIIRDLRARGYTFVKVSDAL